MKNEDIPGRDLAALAVPRWGQLVGTGNRYEPYRLLDPDGVTVEAIAVYFQELLAAGKAPSTIRSYGMDLLRWWRFLQAVGISWDRATRVEARDFSRWIQLTVKPRRAKTSARHPVRAADAPNPVTGKPSAGPGYAPTTVAHSETVLRRFYDIHRDAGTGPLLWRRRHQARARRCHYTRHGHTFVGRPRKDRPTPIPARYTPHTQAADQHA